MAANSKFLPHAESARSVWIWLQSAVMSTQYRAKTIAAKMSGVPHNQNTWRNLLMKKAAWMLALILATTLGAQAQDAAKKDTPPKPAVGQSQAVLDTWNDVARKLNTMAEDFPEDKYDFKPTPAQRSLPSNYCMPPARIISSSTSRMARSRPPRKSPSARASRTKRKSWPT